MALLNPATAESMVWPLQLKFTGELETEAMAFLEAALMEANMGREKILKGYRRCRRPGVHPSSSSDYDAIDNVEKDSLEVCSIEVQDFGHQMCAACMLALCCHSKPIRLDAHLNSISFPTISSSDIFSLLFCSL
jgi:E3 ubiquitin-protein ligase XBAT32/33